MSKNNVIIAGYEDELIACAIGIALSWINTLHCMTCISPYYCTGAATEAAGIGALYWLLSLLHLGVLPVYITELDTKHTTSRAYACVVVAVSIVLLRSTHVLIPLCVLAIMMHYNHFKFSDSTIHKGNKYSDCVYMLQA